MSSLNSNCGCGNNGYGLFGSSSCTWIILLLLFCGGNNGCGNNGTSLFGGNNGGCCDLLIWLLILSSCCGGNNGYNSANNGCNSCGC